MISPLKKFFVHFSHFFTGMALSQLLGLITFPILTRLLTKEDYGVLGLVTTTMLFAVAVAKAGLSNGIIRFYTEYNKTPEQLAKFSSTIMIRGFIFSILATIGYLAILIIIYYLFGNNEKYIISFMVMAFYLFVRPLNIIVLNLLRVTGKTVFFNVLGFIERVLSIGLSLFLLIYIFRELYGYFIGVVFTEVFISIVLFSWFFSNYKMVTAKASWDLTVKLIKFGTPLLFIELSSLLLAYADRYIVVAYLGKASLGLYSVGYNLAMYLANIIIYAISYAVVPIYVQIFEKEGKEKTEDFLQKCMHYLLIIIIPVCIGYTAVSKDLLITLASEKYVDASAFSPIILIGTFLLGMNNILNAGLYLQKKSVTILIIMLLAVITNIALNFIMLPLYGLTGAAIATLLSCMVATGLTVILSYRYIIVKIDLKTLLYYTVISFIMYFIVSYVKTPVVWMTLISKVIVGILIILPAVLFREKEILEKINELFLVLSIKYQNTRHR